MTERKVLYNLQYNVITYSPQGVPVPVCFYGPKDAGFSSVDKAQAIVKMLEAADTETRRIRVYDILPVMVAEEYGTGPEVTLSMEGNEDYQEDFSEEDEPPPSN